MNDARDDVLSESDSALWQRAGASDLSFAECEALIATGIEAVLVGLAANPDAPESILGLLAEREDHIGSVARGNANAPADSKARAPLAEHSSLGIARFLEQRGATATQARALLRLYDRSIGTEKLLGDAWDEVVTSS